MLTSKSLEAAIWEIQGIRKKKGSKIEKKSQNWKEKNNRKKRLRITPRRGGGHKGKPADQTQIMFIVLSCLVFDLEDGSIIDPNRWEVGVGELLELGRGVQTDDTSGFHCSRTDPLVRSRHARMRSNGRSRRRSSKVLWLATWHKMKFYFLYLDNTRRRPSKISTPRVHSIHISLFSFDFHSNIFFKS